MKAGSTTVSVCILTYNEETRLRDCLISAAWCDEIVVVDGFSTDGTVALARQFTTSIFQSDLLGPKNLGGFAAQRNFGLQQATSDWVFFLDADERFTPELAEEVSQICRSRIPSDAAAFSVRRREHFFGVHTPYTHGEAWQIRLLRKGQGHWDGRLVHEGLVLQGPVARLNGWLLHYSKDSIAEYVATQNRYTSLEAVQAASDGQPLPRSPLNGMIKTFLNLYVYKGSYREGAFGLIMSLFFTHYSFLCWAKRWEIEKEAGRLASPSSPRQAALEKLASAFHPLWNRFSPPR